ncbi:MAG TPA: rRNA maturation RNase YbeY [Actinobacteria bacterium]|nr:rRNA maturation RNase YbeY [Actinomycetota bacterium]
MSSGPVPKPAAAGPVVLVSNRQRTPVDIPALVDLASRTLVAEGRPDVELSLSFVTPAEIEELHVRFMDEPGPTDVLSFPLDEDGLLGDVVVCPDVAAANAPDLDGELRQLVVHGILHLLGFDHQEEGERAVMWERQERHSGVSAP